VPSFVVAAFDEHAAAALAGETETLVVARGNGLEFRRVHRVDTKEPGSQGLVHRV
jgi:hypothetical protein